MYFKTRLGLKVNLKKIVFKRKSNTKQIFLRNKKNLIMQHKITNNLALL